jgi:hypothetical protein
VVGSGALSPDFRYIDNLIMHYFGQWRWTPMLIAHYIADYIAIMILLALIVVAVVLLERRKSR